MAGLNPSPLTPDPLSGPRPLHAVGERGALRIQDGDTASREEGDKDRTPGISPS